MCGIAGYVAADGRELPAESASAMGAAIRYRGRDGEGVWSDGCGTHLFHARLSVIDLATGSQPLGDGRYTIVFNGEIYNYLELRAEYERQGVHFSTHSDTEVILAGYRLKGPSVCDALNGMFAFAIWDSQTGELFLARDRLGKKPLFWSTVGQGFAFASTMDAFSGLPRWSGRLSEAGIALYGLLGAFPGSYTVYRDAHSLLPGTRALLKRGETAPRLETYWRLSFVAKRRETLPALLDEYETLLTDAVRLRLRSDVPLALTFSGGVDSGTLAAVCARRLQTQVACYTIDYHTAEDPSEEAVNAEIAARHLGLDWHYIHFDYHHRLLDELSEAYRPYDQPCQQLALVYSHRLYEAIKPYATVVLSGNGADELFTGYIGDERVYRQGLALAALAPLRPWLRHGRLSPYLRLPLPQAYAEAQLQRARTTYSSPALLDELAAALRGVAEEAGQAGANAGLDLKMWMALRCSGSDANFRLPDISGLAAQVEVRSPFLDYRMVEFAAVVPHRYKVGNPFSAGRNKYLPKQYYERQVPRALAWSRKKGMGWNLRWDRSIARDPVFRRVFARAFERLDASSLGGAHFRAAWQAYIADVERGHAFSPHASRMMNGFMLGAWLVSRGL